MEMDAANYQDFQWAFGLNRYSLDLIGVWPSDDSDYTRALFKSLRIPFMLLWMLLGLLLPQMYALSQVFHELPLVVDNLTTSCGVLTSSIKLFLLWKSRQVLRPVIKSTMTDWTTNLNSHWEHEVMVRQARRARIFTISGYAIMFMCFVGFVASPIFGLYIRAINNITDLGDGPFLPLQSYYPYEASTSPYFELTYLSQLIGGSFVGISFSVPDNFFGALVFHASGQCEILGQRMGKLVPREHRYMVTDKWFSMKLRQLVGDHEHLIRFVNAIESSFNLLILAQAVCLSLNICCLGFAAIKSLGTENKRPAVVQIATLTGTLLNLMIHMFVYCIASEILAKHSLGFFHSIYCSDWYLLPPKFSRDIIPIMMRSKIPLKLTAGKFFYLSLNMYLKIIKTSVGYISMLLAVSNQ